MVTGVVLVHGFGGDRTVWDALAPELEAAGVAVHALALAGHEQDAAALAEVSWQTWLDQMRQAVADLRTRVEHVGVVGYSMGSTIGLHAIAEELVDSAVLICPSISVSRLQRGALKVMEGLRVGSVPRKLVGTGDASDPDAPGLPVAALRTNVDFKDHARRLVLKRPAPTLILAGSVDPVAGPAEVAEVLALFPAGTPAVTVAGADHGVVDGPLAEQVAELTTRFVSLREL